MITAEQAVKFILDYESGDYGYAVRDEWKALMYARAAAAVGLDVDLDEMRRVFEKHVGCSNSYAWVGPKGEIVYVAWASHSTVAESAFFVSEAVFEKTWAKVGKFTETAGKALKFVSAPTRHQRQAVEDVLANRREAILAMRPDLNTNSN